MCTRCDASAMTSGGRPCASGPNSHAVRADRSAARMSTEASSAVASTSMPLSRIAETTAAASGSTTTGSEKMLPAEDRRHLPL